MKTGNKINIVIADDDLEHQKLIKEAIARAGLNFESSSVYNGFQLMDFLLKTNSYKNNENNIPDLILLDISMPFMNGYGVLREIRKHPLLMKIPVYVISANAAGVDINSSLELGASGFYTKPSGEEGYQQIIEEIISQDIFLFNRVER